MSATTCRACGGYVGHAVPHFCDLAALAPTGEPGTSGGDADA